MAKRITRVRQSDVLKLRKRELQVLVLEILNLAVEDASRNVDAEDPRGRSYCTMTPDEVLEAIEDVVGRAW